MMSQSGIGPESPYDSYKLRSPYERKPPCFQAPDEPFDDDEEFAQDDLPQADEDEDEEDDDLNDDGEEEKDDY